MPVHAPRRGRAGTGRATDVRAANGIAQADVQLRSPKLGGNVNSGANDCQPQNLGPGATTKSACGRGTADLPATPDCRISPANCKRSPCGNPSPSSPHIMTRKDRDAGAAERLAASPGGPGAASDFVSGITVSSRGVPPSIDGTSCLSRCCVRPFAKPFLAVPARVATTLIRPSGGLLGTIERRRSVYAYRRYDRASPLRHKRSACHARFAGPPTDHDRHPCRQGR